MVIDIRSLQVVRNRKPILTDITCGVPKGRVVGLIGPSGSGKTTLMRAIVGAQTIRRGSVTVLGEPAGSEALRHQIGYMSQGAGVYADLSVIENLRYFSRLLHLPKAEADRVLGIVELSPQRNQTVATLSGGQVVRVSLAIALLGTPPLLVLDEPTVGLDPLLRQKLWQLFDNLAGAGTTLLVSSHVMDEAEKCGELLLMRGGRLIAQGSAMTLLQKTRTDSLEQAFIALAKEQGDTHV
ncbi:MAG TPA: ABC transporter ATP-binding protein [Candidatus Saccharimonadales bacterium]|nr:ABC transporter ATP-binding protein [Candidatus Saccharimonadales bacterium]